MLSYYTSPDFEDHRLFFGISAHAFIWPNWSVYRKFRTDFEKNCILNMFGLSDRFMRRHKTPFNFPRDEDELLMVREQGLEEFCPLPARRMARFLMDNGKVTVELNMYGRGDKEIFWMHPEDYFAGLFWSDEEGMPGMHFTSFRDGTTTRYVGRRRFDPVDPGLDFTPYLPALQDYELDIKERLPKGAIPGMYAGQDDPEDAFLSL